MIKNEMNDKQMQDAIDDLPKLGAASTEDVLDWYTKYYKTIQTTLKWHKKLYDALEFFYSEDYYYSGASCPEYEEYYNFLLDTKEYGLLSTSPIDKCNVQDEPSETQGKDNLELIKECEDER